MATVIIQRTRRGRSVTITPDKVMIDGKEVVGKEADDQRRKAARMAAEGAKTAVRSVASILNISSIIGQQVIVTQRSGRIINIDGDVTIRGGKVTVTDRKKR